MRSDPRGAPTVTKTVTVRRPTQTNWDQSGPIGEFTQLLAERDFLSKTASCGGGLIRRFSDSKSPGPCAHVGSISTDRTNTFSSLRICAELGTDSLFGRDVQIVSTRISLTVTTTFFLGSVTRGRSGLWHCRPQSADLGEPTPIKARLLYPPFEHRCSDPAMCYQMEPEQKSLTLEVIQWHGQVKGRK